MMLFVLAFLILPFTANSQEKTTKEEQAVNELRQIMTKTNAVGLAVAVVKDGKIIFVK